MKASWWLCWAGLVLIQGAWAGEASGILSIEEAIAQARQAYPGTVIGAELDCPTTQSCAYQIRIRESSGQVLATRVDARPVPVAPVSTVLDQGQAGGNVAVPSWTQLSGLSRGLDVKTSGSVTVGTGQLAGMGNVILEPKLQLGLGVLLHHPDFPRWDADGNLQILYGSTQSSDPVTLQNSVSQSALQELRGQGHLIYNFHQDGQATKVGVGLYADMARPLHDLPRYIPAQVDSVYAAEEGEITSHALDLGLDLRYVLNERRVSSELHNILFISGNRIAPNLLSYQPMLGFMWSNAFAIAGDIGRPGNWSLVTDVDFYFARKAGVTYFNTHDGIGGTKRELDLSYGLTYEVDPATRVSFKSYGYNNLNRGNSSMVPTGFKDGFRMTVLHRFD